MRYVLCGPHRVGPSTAPRGWALQIRSRSPFSELALRAQCGATTHVVRCSKAAPLLARALAPALGCSTSTLPPRLRWPQVPETQVHLACEWEGVILSLKPAEAASRVPFPFRHTCGDRGGTCSSAGPASLQSPPPENLLVLDILHCGGSALLG